ncbi:flavin reductase family protein [uncultured Microbacterium sp.]|uniref:flavin reductase family protein n=1 Tax=uncultured Microbacterium sp. TaxID=191216 RepID=UPI0025FE6B94|nr:flavin reductase family protein [uncultured Microbacterium sp.]
MTTTHPFTTDPADMAAAFSAFPSGVAALAAEVAGESVVMIASSFTVGVSYDPPMVSFAAQKSSSTWPILASAPTIGVSILGEAHAESTRQLASREKHKRLHGVEWTRMDSGAIFLAGSPTWLECVIEHVYPAGDHDIIVFRVLAMFSDEIPSPLVWHRRQIKLLPA